MELKEIKEYLRVDFEEDDILLQNLIYAAEEYLLNAGIKKDYSKSLYKLAISLLVKHWYDNIDSVAIGSTTKKLEFSLNSILVQLKYCGDKNG